MRNTRAILDQYNIKLTKSLGQNFLTDESVVEDIVRGSGVTKDDVVLEIGPGAGSMTRLLCDAAGFVLALEIDTKLMPVLNSVLALKENVKVINCDALKADIKALLEKELPEQFRGARVCVVANLPYYITTPLIMRLLEDEEAISSMTFMVQREVALRMAASEGGKDYGALSLAVQYYSEPELLFEVSPHCFFPQPEVTSTVIKLERREKPPVQVDKPMLFKVIKASFAQRRKTLVNGLCNSGFFGLGKAEMTALLESVDINPGCRGEQLKLQDFAKIADALDKIMKF